MEVENFAMASDTVTQLGGDQATKTISPADVTVVVPSYNHAPFVERCLISIQRQTFAPARLVVIDDGSTDGSPRLIERALNSCPFPSELVVRQNKGLCATLNEGLALSKTRYFAYLSSDDLWLPTFLESRVKLLEAQPDAVLAYGHAYLINEDDYIFECSADWKLYTQGSLRERLLQAIGPLSPTVLYRQSALERHGWNEHAQLEDYELYLRLITEGAFAFGVEPLGAWRRHWYNTSRNYSMMMDEWLDAQRRVAAKLSICTQELERIQNKLRFRCAEEIVRHGRKSEAISLMRRNPTCVTSHASLVRMVVRLMIPQFLIRWRKNMHQHDVAMRYGSLHTYVQE